MKKIINFKKFAMSAILLAAVVTFPLQVNAQSAFEQLQQAADDGQSAVNSNSNEEASWYASQNFDTVSTDPSVVDLSGAGEHPTPQLLRNPGD